MPPSRDVVYHCKVMADSKPAALGSAAASLITDSVSRVRPNARLIGLLALGHLVIDTNQGSLPAVLPFLKSAHGLSYAEAGPSFSSPTSRRRSSSRSSVTWPI